MSKIDLYSHTLSWVFFTQLFSPFNFKRNNFYLFNKRPTLYLRVLFFFGGGANFIFACLHLKIILEYSFKNWVRFNVEDFWFHLVEDEIKISLSKDMKLKRIFNKFYYQQYISPSWKIHFICYKNNHSHKFTTSGIFFFLKERKKTSGLRFFGYKRNFFFLHFAFLQ